jgi:hypothetical protein
MDGLRSLLAPECELAGTVGDGRALVSAVEQLHPDVIVVDTIKHGCLCCRVTAAISPRIFRKRNITQNAPSELIDLWDVPDPADRVSHAPPSRTAPIPPQASDLALTSMVLTLVLDFSGSGGNNRN